MRRLFFFFLLFVSCNGWAQPSAVVDSLKSLLRNNSLSATERIDMLNEIAFQRRAELDTSVAMARENRAQSVKLGYQKGEAAALVLMAHFYWTKQENDKSIEYALSALRLFQSLNDQKGMMDAHQMMGLIYLALQEKSKAEESLRLSLGLAQQLKSDEAIARAYNGLGVAAKNAKDRSKELDFYQKALSHLEASDNYPLKVMVLRNIGEVYRALNDNDKALYYYKESLRIAEKLNDISGQSLSNLGIGKLYGYLGDQVKSEEYLLKGERLARRSGQKRDLLNAYMSQIIAKTRVGQSELAHEYQIKYYQLKDSIFSAEKSRQIAELEIAYETEKKEQTIKLLEQENQIKALSRNLLFAGLAFVILIAAIIFYFLGQKSERIQRQLKQQEDFNHKLLEADKLKSRFFSNISHEFRTPLTLILVPAEERLASADLAQKDHVAFQSIRRSASRLLELVNQILELAKLESGFMKLQLEPGSLHRSITPILSLFDSMADVNQVRYVKRLQVTDTPVLFDEDKLEKILNNLLANAFKFSPKGSELSARVVATESEQSVVLVIEISNQYFISTETIAEIFEPYFQGEQAIHDTPGTGLGLPLVRELVKLHGGTIQVNSHETEGTLFTVSLSLQKAETTAVVSTKLTSTNTSSIEEELAHAELNASDNAHETVLIVDDNPEVRSLIRKGLQADYSVLEAADGEEGILMAQNQSIDLVVSDVMMPIKNGVELCHALKNNELTSHIPVVLLTARADHESKLEGLKTGADDYVTKPFNMTELLVRVANLIEQRKKLIQKYKQTSVIQPHEIAVTPLDERFIKKAIDIVESNLDNTEFSVELFCIAMGMSRMNLHRKLKSITGLATNEFIQDFRLKRAALLIEKKADTLAQIAYMVGFNDPSYFTKAFKKKFGKTPSEYVEQMA